MEKIFVDANYFIALFNPEDALHKKAREITSTIETASYHFVTSNFIFLEAVTVLSQRRGKDVARDAGLHLRSDPHIQIIHVDETLHQDAWNIFQRLPEKNISFVDCATVAVMRTEHITQLLTFDTTDFRKLQREYRFSFFS